MRSDTIFVLVRPLRLSLRRIPGILRRAHLRHIDLRRHLGAILVAPLNSDFRSFFAREISNRSVRRLAALRRSGRLRLSFQTLHHRVVVEFERLFHSIVNADCNGFRGHVHALQFSIHLLTLLRLIRLDFAFGRRTWLVFSRAILLIACLYSLVALASDE